MYDSPTKQRVTFFKLVWQETRDDYIQVYAHYEFTRAETDVFNHLIDLPAPISTKQLYLVRMHGLRAYGENLEELVSQMKRRTQKSKWQ